jgi:hypothetical protein
LRAVGGEVYITEQGAEHSAEHGVVDGGGAVRKQQATIAVWRLLAMQRPCAALCGVVLVSVLCISTRGSSLLRLTHTYIPLIFVRQHAVSGLCCYVSIYQIPI